MYTARDYNPIYEFESAYSPTFETWVKFLRAYRDSAGDPIYVCSVPLVNSSGVEETYEILFRHSELKNFVV